MYQCSKKYTFAIVASKKGYIHVGFMLDPNIKIDILSYCIIADEDFDFSKFCREVIKKELAANVDKIKNPKSEFLKSKKNGKSPGESNA